MRRILERELPEFIARAQQHAKASGLIYGSDSEPGIARTRRGRQQQAVLDDRQLARVIERGQQLPGQQLVQHVDDGGKHQPIDAGMVNDYLRKHATPLNFRVSAAPGQHGLISYPLSLKMRAHDGRRGRPLQRQ